MTVKELIARSKAAQAEFAFATQEQADAAAKAICKVVYDNAEKLGPMAAEESRMGSEQDKIAKCRNKSALIWESLKGKKSCDIINRIEERRMIEVAKPVGVVASIIWVYLYNGQISPIVKGLESIGIHVDFFANNVVLGSMANITTWTFTGYNMLIFLAALQAIPHDLYEAARIDGASGFQIAMKTLDGGRLGIAAQSVGIAQSALDEAVKYAKERKQFGRRIADFQGISFMLADMAADVEAARQLVYHAAVLKDANSPEASSACSIAKYFAAEAANRCAYKAVQIHGGYGYIKEYPVERKYRDCRVFTIYEGTSQVQQMVIAGNLLK